MLKLLMALWPIEEILHDPYLNNIFECLKEHCSVARNNGDMRGQATMVILFFFANDDNLRISKTF